MVKIEDFMYVPLADWEQYDFSDGLLEKFQWIYNKVASIPTTSPFTEAIFLQYEQMRIQDRVNSELFRFLFKRDELVLKAKTTVVSEPFCVELYLKYTGYTSFNNMYLHLLEDDLELYDEPFTIGKEIYTPKSPPLMGQIEYQYFIPFRNTGSNKTEEELTSDVETALINMVAYLNTQFGLDDLVKGEPYSLPPSNADLASQAIVGGLASFGISQVVPLGTFALQILEQVQTQKLNYIQDIQFQLIIAMFKVIIAGLWPKGDLSELLASFSSLDTGLEYRAKVNDHWLNQSLTRALNSFTNESEYPLDVPSLDKVVAEKTDLVGVQYGNFKKLWPFQAASNDIFYTSEELKIVPWPKQLFFIQE